MKNGVGSGFPDNYFGKNSRIFGPGVISRIGSFRKGPPWARFKERSAFTLTIYPKNIMNTELMKRAFWGGHVGTLLGAHLALASCTGGARKIAWFCPVFPNSLFGSTDCSDYMNDAHRERQRTIGFRLKKRIHRVLPGRVLFVNVKNINRIATTSRKKSNFFILFFLTLVLLYEAEFSVSCNRVSLQ